MNVCLKKNVKKINSSHDSFFFSSGGTYLGCKYLQISPPMAIIIIATPITRIISWPGRFIGAEETGAGISEALEAADVDVIIIVIWEGITCPPDVEFFAEIADADDKMQLI